MNKSLQQRFAPRDICFGCGQANPQGLRLQSYPEGELLVARWMPQDHHQAFVGILNGGIIGTLLDCHCNWAAAWHLKVQNDAAQPPCTLTAEYSIKLIHPTPTDSLLELRSWVVKSRGRMRWPTGN